MKNKRHPIHNMYSVSRCGKVYSHKTKKFLTPFLNGDKNRFRYRTVSLDNSRKKISVLILETYIGPRPKGFHAAHLDGNRFNDNIKNLKWVSPKENASHREAHGTVARGEKHGAHKLTESEVIAIRKTYIKGKNCPELAEKYNVVARTIRDVVNYRTWRHL